MKLLEITNDFTTVYRTMGIPVQTILTSNSDDFRDPTYNTTHSGIWVALDKEFVQRYGAELGDTHQLSVPTMAQYSIPTSMLQRQPDVKSEGNAYKLPLSFDLGPPSNVQMFIGEWQPFNKSTIVELPQHLDMLEVLLNSQEYFPSYHWGSVQKPEQLDLEKEFPN